MTETPQEPTVLITWTKPKLKKFKAVYDKAKTADSGDGLSIFQFEGHDLLVGYAGRLIEYLESLDL